MCKNTAFKNDQQVSGYDRFIRVTKTLRCCS